MSSDEQVVPEASPEQEEKKAEKKQKNLEQLKIAREKAVQKKREKSEEAQKTKDRLAELEKRLTQQAIAKEDDEPQQKQIVTRQQVEEVKTYEPSLANEIKKMVCLGALGVASFLVSRRYGQQPVIPHSPAPAKRPAPPTSTFLEQQPSKKKHLPPVPLFSDSLKNPVGASGFFQ